MYQTSDDQTKKFIDKKRPELQKYTEKNPIAYYLCMGNLYVTLGEKIYSKLRQIDRYDWVTKDMVKLCHKNLSKNVGDTAEYEQELGQFENNSGKYFQYVTNTYGKINIKGRVDCYDDNTLWEFKCVASLQIEHMLQLVVYAWIWEKCMKEKLGSRGYKILNIRTGEVQQLKYESYIVEEIMNILFANKYKSKEKDDDVVFIEKCNKTAETFAQKGTAGKNIFIFTDETTGGSRKNYDDDDDDVEEDSPSQLNTNMFGVKKKQPVVKEQHIIEKVKKPKKTKSKNDVDDSEEINEVKPKKSKSKSKD